MKTDSEITLEVLNGNKNAYAELVLRHEGKIRGYCLGVFGNDTMADDAAQEVFIKAYQALSSFKGSSAFGTWLYRIAINHCRDLLRKKMRKREDSLDKMREDLGSSFDSKFGTPSGQNAFAARELAEKLLASLSPQAREVIVLREIQELSYDEIAETLQCSLDAVKSRIKRARQEIEEKNRHLLQSARV